MSYYIIIEIQHKCKGRHQMFTMLFQPIFLGWGEGFSAHLGYNNIKSQSYK